MQEPTGPPPMEIEPSKKMPLGKKILIGIVVYIGITGIGVSIYSAANSGKDSPEQQNNISAGVISNAVPFADLEGFRSQWNHTLKMALVDFSDFHQKQIKDGSLSPETEHEYQTLNDFTNRLFINGFRKAAVTGGDSNIYDVYNIIFSDPANRFFGVTKVDPKTNEVVLFILPTPSGQELIGTITVFMLRTMGLTSSDAGENTELILKQAQNQVAKDSNAIVLVKKNFNNFSIRLDMENIMVSEIKRR